MLSHERRFQPRCDYLEPRSMRSRRARPCIAIVEAGGGRIHISGFVDWRQAAHTNPSPDSRTSCGSRVEPDSQQACVHRRQGVESMIRPSGVVCKLPSDMEIKYFIASESRIHNRSQGIERAIALNDSWIEGYRVLGSPDTSDTIGVKPRIFAQNDCLRL